VKYGAVNATLPRDKPPEELTVEEAIALIAARAAKGGGGRKPARASNGKTAKRAAEAPVKRAAKTPAKRPRKKAAAGAADA
jgi:DNA topoisomerase-1